MKITDVPGFVKWYNREQRGPELAEVDGKPGELRQKSEGGWKPVAEDSFWYDYYYFLEYKSKNLKLAPPKLKKNDLDALDEDALERYNSHLIKYELDYNEEPDIAIQGIYLEAALNKRTYKSAIAMAKIYQDEISKHRKTHEKEPSKRLRSSFIRKARQEDIFSQQLANVPSFYKAAYHLGFPIILIILFASCYAIISI